jgi:hypothetical protein
MVALTLLPTPLWHSAVHHIDVRLTCAAMRAGAFCICWCDTIQFDDDDDPIWSPKVGITDAGGRLLCCAPLLPWMLQSRSVDSVRAWLFPTGRGLQGLPSQWQCATPAGCWEHSVLVAWCLLLSSDTVTGWQPEQTKGSLQLIAWQIICIAAPLRPLVLH